MSRDTTKYFRCINEWWLDWSLRVQFLILYLFTFIILHITVLLHRQRCSAHVGFFMNTKLEKSRWFWAKLCYFKLMKCESLWKYFWHLIFNIRVVSQFAVSPLKSQKNYFVFDSNSNMKYVLSACAGAGVMHAGEQLGVLVRAEVICGHLSQDPCLQGQTT